jgi:hypothetical protein
MQSRYATDTPQIGCAAGYTGVAGAGCTVIATLAGKIRQSWLDIFGTANTWTALNTFTNGLLATASSTVNSRFTIPASNTTTNAFVANGVAYQWPTADGTNGFALTTNASGVLSWSSLVKIAATTTSATYTDRAAPTVWTVTIPANTLTGTNGIRGRIYTTWRTVSTTAKSVVLTLDGNTCVTTGNATPGATTDITYAGYIEFSIFANNSSSAQTCTASFNGAVTQANLTGSSGMMSTGGTGTLSKDGTTPLSLVISVNQNASDVLTTYTGSIEWIH